MSNELLLLLSALADISFIFIVARFGPTWLFGTIAVNLILIAVFGAKLVSVFGFVTNAANVFYACVFFATHLLLERQGKKIGFQTIWFGSSLVALFLILSQFAVHFLSVYPNDAINTAIQTLFLWSPRIALASISAYIFAQKINVTIYEWLKERTAGRFLWLRTNAANIAAQLVDSSLFFTIAFLDLPGPVLVQAIIAGWILKSAVVMIGTPFLYLDGYLTKKYKTAL